MSSGTSRVSALVRTLILASFFVGGVLVGLPWALGVFRRASGPRARWEWLGVVPLLVGACLGLYCASAFAWSGRGTPAPFDPPRTLVIQGVYRYTRNPMYWGAFLVLIGQWALFGAAWAALVYVACFVTLAHLLVYFHEEPSLHEEFGADYDDYCRNVPRWIPRLKPWTQPRTESIPADTRH